MIERSRSCLALTIGVAAAHFSAISHVIYSIGPTLMSVVAELWEIAFARPEPSPTLRAKIGRPAAVTRKAQTQAFISRHMARAHRRKGPWGDALGRIASAA